MVFKNFIVVWVIYWFEQEFFVFFRCGDWVEVVFFVFFLVAGSYVKVFFVNMWCGYELVVVFFLFYLQEIYQVVVQLIVFGQLYWQALFYMVREYEKFKFCVQFMMVMLFGFFNYCFVFSQFFLFGEGDVVYMGYLLMVFIVLLVSVCYFGDFDGFDVVGIGYVWAMVEVGEIVLFV